MSVVAKSREFDVINMIVYYVLAIHFWKLLFANFDVHYVSVISSHIHIEAADDFSESPLNRAAFDSKFSQNLHI